MKKRVITIKIAVHPIQADLMLLIRNGKIDVQKDSLREMAQKIGVKESPQVVKHHLEQLVKLGALQKMWGQYEYVELKD